MHFVRNVKYAEEYKLFLTFEDGTVRLVDLKGHLEGEIFEPLKDIKYFQKVYLDKETDTIAWDNGADISPDFLYETGTMQSEIA